LTINQDKQYSKKSVPLSTYLNVNSSQNQQTKNNSIKIEDKSSQLTTEETSKITIKDLCNEDKQRIANLIKEIARLEAVFTFTNFNLF
jgi:hypothetical protein